MNILFCFLLMLFCHVFDDFFLQNCLSDLKTRVFWSKWTQENSSYKNDYIAALIMHSISWSFMIMLPLAIRYSFNVPILFGILFIVNVVIHAYVDNLKANKYKINLIQDQSIHILQIILTFLILI